MKNALCVVRQPIKEHRREARNWVAHIRAPLFITLGERLNFFPLLLPLLIHVLFFSQNQDLEKGMNNPLEWKGKPECFLGCEGKLNAHGKTSV